MKVDQAMFFFFPPFLLDGVVGTNRPNLDIGKRIELIHDVARGLNYVLNESNTRMVHRDMTPENILLDSKMRAKIADFGTVTEIRESRPQFISSEHTRPNRGLGDAHCPSLKLRMCVA